MATRKKGMNFEENLEALEALVEALEDGELSLEESLKTFEKGVKLTRQCQEALQKAEQKVQMLIDEGDSIAFADYGDDED